MDVSQPLSAQTADGAGSSALSFHSEIVGLKARYCHAVDATIRDPGRVGELLELLHEDVVVDYGAAGGRARGRDAVRRLYQEALCGALAWSFHSASNPIIERTGETTATGRWYVHAFGVYKAAPGAGPQPVFGRYLERYQHTETGWKIVEVVLLLDTPPTAA